MRVRVAPKDPDELREHATRLALDAIAEGNSRAVFRRIGEQLGIDPETLRGCTVFSLVGFVCLIFKRSELGSSPGQVVG